MRLSAMPITPNSIYVWQAHGDDNIISDTLWKGGVDVPSGGGQRLIMNDRGSEDGFLESCGECFIGKKDISDYHGEMNGYHFDKLPDQSVVVIGNAKYYSRQTGDSKKPTTGWRKAKIQKWMAERGVSFDPNDTIPILLMKSKCFCPKKFNWRILRKDIMQGREKLSKFCAC